jgi:molecular chaperone DnaK
MVGGVYEVRASHGDTKLGGDDFDELILQLLLEDFQKAHGGDPEERRQIRR